MKAKYLIERLQSVDPDAEVGVVMVDGDHTWVEPVTVVEVDGMGTTARVGLMPGEPVPAPPGVRAGSHRKLLPKPLLNLTHELESKLELKIRSWSREVFRAYSRAESDEIVGRFLLRCLANAKPVFEPVQDHTVANGVNGYSLSHVPALVVGEDSTEAKR